jgi:hypothetical protein
MGMGWFHWRTKHALADANKNNALAGPRDNPGAGAALFLLLLVTLAAGCATSTTGTTAHQTATSSLVTPTRSVTVTATPAAVPTMTTPSGPCPNEVLATATVPPAPAPTPIAAVQWTTYTNTSFHYSVQYPVGWYVPDTSPASNDFSLLNFDPRTYHPGADALPPPPYTKIEIRPLQGSENQTPPEAYAAGYTNNPLAAPECSRTATQTTIAGHNALQVVQWPAASGYGPPTTFPQVFYYVVVGTGQPLLSLGEAYSPGGQPSPPLARMLASLQFTV